MKNKLDLISLAEYAKAHNKNVRYLRHKAKNGRFKTAIKIGRNWLIDKNEEYIDLRFKGDK